MINASGPTTDTNSNSAGTTPSVTPTVPVNFPTHNPASQHSQFMSGVATPQPSNPNQAVPPAAPKFPDPTSQLIKTTETTETLTGSSDDVKPKLKMSMKTIIGVVVLIIVLFGSGAGFYLTQYTQQDTRQQAAYPSAAMCPDGSGPAVWCATFDCSVSGDVNGDGQCTSADGVQPYIGVDCPAPSKRCGQIDYYRAGPSGQNWDAFCGAPFHHMDECPTGGGTPTPAPPQVSCNQACTTDSQCPASLKCLTAYDFNGVWQDSTSSVQSVGTGTITSFKAFVRTTDASSHVEQYMVRNGVIWHRTSVTSTTWQDVTANVSSVGSGTITSFSVYANTSNVIEQWLTRGGQVWYRSNPTGTWENITANFAAVGSGTIHAYTADKYSANHGNIVSGYLMRGTQVWQHTSSNWSLWQDVTANVTSIPGSSGTITSFSMHVNPDGSIRHHAVIGGKIWVREALQLEEKRCRLPAYPNSGSCQAPTATAQDVACTGMTGVLKTGPITNLTAPLSYTVTTSGNVNKIELVAHGNFTPPAMGTGWATIATDTTPNDGGFTMTGTTTYGQMVDALVATGHDRQKLMTSGIVYFANVYGPKGFCTGANVWSVGGGACTRNAECNGTALLTTVATATPTATPTSTPPVVYQCNSTCSTDTQCTGSLGSGYSCYKASTSLLADSSAGNCRLTANPTSTSCTAAPVVCNSVCTPTNTNKDSLLPADDICTKKNPLWNCDPTTSRCRLTANPTSVSCDAAPLVCNSSCNPSAKSDLCTAANDKWYCDPTASACRFKTNPTSTSCQPPVGSVACNQACTSNAQCTSTNANYTCDSTSNTCRLSSNPTSTTCEPVPPKCNEACTTNAQCEKGDPDHYCDSTTNTCRLETNPSSTTCVEPAATPTPTPAIGCNDSCVTNADCSNSNHICVTTADGSNKCRLESYTTSESCTLPTTSTAQPTLPPQLPATGPADWMNWLKAGLVTLGLGAALFFLL